MNSSVFQNSHQHLNTPIKDTFGHCYFLEDGVEENNIFRDNLGLGVKNAERLLSHLSGKEETDDQSSVFWISNPMNYL